MGKLNKMMGSQAGGDMSNKTVQERKLSWEDIPLFVGGENKITPQEEQEKADKEILMKLEQQLEENK